MPATLYFLRHGETGWNAERRMQGQWESDLSDLGRRQARETAARVSALGVDAVYASPLRRARDSAQALADRTGLSLSFDDRIKEWRAGDWSGWLYAEIVEKWPAEWAARRADMWRYRPPNAENFVDLKDRGGAFLDELLRAGAGRIAIVSHGFITRAMLAHLLVLSEEDALRIHMHNDTFFRARFEDGAWMAERFDAWSGPAPDLFASAKPKLA